MSSWARARRDVPQLINLGLDLHLSARRAQPADRGGRADRRAGADRTRAMRWPRSWPSRLCQYIRRRNARAALQDADPLQSLRAARHVRCRGLASWCPPIIAKMHEASRRAGRRSRSGATAPRGASSCMRAIWPMRCLRAAADMDDLPDTMNVGVGHGSFGHRLLPRPPPRSSAGRARFAHDLTKPVGMKRKLCDTSSARPAGAGRRRPISRRAWPPPIAHYLERQSGMSPAFPSPHRPGTAPSRRPSSASSRSDMFSMGAEVAEFERRFAAHFGSTYAVMVNSGSSANLLMRPRCL